MSQEHDILKRALEREKAARKAAEKILEEKSRELYTTSQKLEHLLDEKSSQLQGVFENIIDAYVLMDINGNVLKLNEAATKLFGYDIDKESVNVVDLIYKEDYQYAMLSYTDLQAKGSFKDYEARVYTKSGEVKWVHINASIVFDNNKTPIAAQGIVRDITADREKSIIIDLINNLTKSILDKTDINEIAWEIVSNIGEYLDSDDCIIYLVNYEKENLEQIAAYGDKINDDNKIVSTLFLPIGTGIVGSVVNSKKSELIKDTSKDHRYVVDIERRFSEITIPIINNGRVIGIIDSEHKNKNHYTDEHVKTLENIAGLVAIKLRTALSIKERDKAEAQNVQLLSELEKSNNELHEYAHIVSHDLKSPLRSIDALVSWIKNDNEGKLDEITIQNFDLIESTLENMDLLISDILEYSSIGTTTENEEEVNLNSIIENLNKTLFIPENISINVVSNLPTVKGDSTKFLQLFQNLISNAVKFSDKEKGIVEIDFKEEPSFYQFSVKDNGIGIDKKFHDKIFKIFHALNKNKDSTGIGLSIVKKIVDLHEGDIWVESDPNIGSTFYFTLKRQL